MILEDLRPLEQRALEMRPTVQELLAAHKANSLGPCYKITYEEKFTGSVVRVVGSVAWVKLTGAIGEVRLPPGSYAIADCAEEMAHTLPKITSLPGYKPGDVVRVPGGVFGVVSPARSEGEMILVETHDKARKTYVEARRLTKVFDEPPTDKDERDMLLEFGPIVWQYARDVRRFHVLWQRVVREPWTLAVLIAHHQMSGMGTARILRVINDIAGYPQIVSAIEALTHSHRNTREWGESVMKFVNERDTSSSG